MAVSGLILYDNQQPRLSKPIQRGSQINLTYSIKLSKESLRRAKGYRVTNGHYSVHEWHKKLATKELWR